MTSNVFQQKCVDESVRCLLVYEFVDSRNGLSLEALVVHSMVFDLCVFEKRFLSWLACSCSRRAPAPDRMISVTKFVCIFPCIFWHCCTCTCTMCFCVLRKPPVPSARPAGPVSIAQFEFFAIVSERCCCNMGALVDAQGMEDLRAGLIRTPLPPKETFLDDPLRVLRATRFSARFGFNLDSVPQDP